MFFCGISGEPPQEPVVSVKSGKVYERRLIVKYIAENGTDPITGEKLEEQDLIAVKASPSSAPPRPPNLASIPSLLHSLQNECDALVLENFALRQQYNATRQELSHALYQGDAGTRVVARLMRERDAAREALANVHATMGITPAPAGGDVEMADGAEQEGTLPAEISSLIEEMHTKLSTARKKRKSPPDYTTADQLRTFAVKHTIPSLHSSSKSGITSLALSRLQPSIFLTGGNDKIVQLFDRTTSKVVATLKGHSQKVNHVAFREVAGTSTLVISASADKTARVWAHDSASGEYAPKQTVKVHKGDVTGLGVHASGRILALGSSDKSWSLHDLDTFQSIYHAGPSDEPFTGLSFHPDGTLLGLGTNNSTVVIYDVRTGTVAASLTPTGSAPFPVQTLSFSENGYHLIAPGSPSTVAVWDLRKLKATHSIDCGENYKINHLEYDMSANFLGVAGTAGARVYAHKSWEEIVRFEERDVSSMKFADGGKEIWGVSGREIKVWGSNDE